MAFTTEEREICVRERECVGGESEWFSSSSYKGPDPTRPDPTRFDHEHSGEEKRKREREGPTNENYERWCQYLSDLFSSLDYALEILTVD